MTMAMLMSGTIGWLVVSSQQSPFNVVFFRCIFGGATLALVCAVLGLFRRQLFSWKMLGLALLGGAAIVINWVLLFAAYSRASISMATAVYNTQPFMLVALGALVFRERISDVDGGLAGGRVHRPRVRREGRAGGAGGAGAVSGRRRVRGGRGGDVRGVVDHHEAAQGHAAASDRVDSGVARRADARAVRALRRVARQRGVHGSNSSCSASSIRASCTCCCTARSRSCRLR